MAGRDAATPTPRTSGLTHLDLALMGKGVVQGRRLMTRSEADEWANMRDLREAAVR